MKLFTSIFNSPNVVDNGIIVKLLVILMALAGPPFGYAQCPALTSMSGESPVTRIELPAKQNSAKAGSSLWVEVTMTNQSDHAISFWKNTNTNAYPIEVTDEAGKPLQDKRPGFRNGRLDPMLLDPKHVDPKLVDSKELINLLSGSLACVTLKPGESIVDRIDVTKFYDMSTPGSYTIAIAGAGPGKVRTAKSSSIKVLVTKK